MEDIQDHSERRLRGIPASPGLVCAQLVVLTPEEFSVPRRSIEESEIPAEIARFEKALLQTRHQIQEIQEHLSSSIGEKDASIFDAHLLVIEDTSLIDAISKQLHSRLLCVDFVFYHIIQRYAQSMRELDDPYLQERASDITDVCKRVLNNLGGRVLSNRYELDEPSIILAHDLSPSHTATLDRAKVLGFATDIGARVSHAAIMARALGIPAVVGLRDASYIFSTGTPAILDGYEGVLIINPSEQTQFEYSQLEEKRHAIDVSLGELRGTEAITRDDHKVIISANIEMPEDLPRVLESGAEGVGLFRTEYLFLGRMALPDEDEQTEVYRSVVEGTLPNQVIFRTLDIGGDKIADGIDLGEELNPFLGWRAIRFSLAREEIFRTQLRAILRGAADHPCRIMFPMISTFEELRQAKAILTSVTNDLKKRKVPHCEEVEVGVMMEIPSLVMIADLIVPHVDFMSIGTNDLIQYTMACDRTNEKVAYLYQPTHPAIVRLIRRVVECGHAGNVWVGVCGEMAADVLMTPLLLGLGVDELSMGSIAIPRVKRAVQRLDHGEMRAFVSDLDHLASAAEIAQKLHGVAQRHYPELLD